MKILNYIIDYRNQHIQFIFYFHFKIIDNITYLWLYVFIQLIDSYYAVFESCNLAFPATFIRLLN